MSNIAGNLLLTRRDLTLSSGTTEVDASPCASCYYYQPPQQ